MPNPDSIRYEKIVVVTKKTALEELIERFNTTSQARFYVEHLGASFDEYQGAHDAYCRSLAQLKTAMPKGVRQQFIERSFLPNFTFGDSDLVVTLGPDGLVVNTAKYLAGQPLVAVNPDPQRMDGILVPFDVYQAPIVLDSAIRDHSRRRNISMARAELNNGQSLYAVNDLFIGQKSHVSARYHISYKRKSEDQSSSGIIVSTGAGSTGWFRSVVTGATEITRGFNTSDDQIPAVENRYRFDWEADYLYFSVREPFVSKISAAGLVFGKIEPKQELVITSQMPQNGVIFSDGIEEDYLEFSSGATAQIGLAEKKLHLVVSA